MMRRTGMPSRRISEPINLFTQRGRISKSSRFRLRFFDNCKTSAPLSKCLSALTFLPTSSGRLSVSGHFLLICTIPNLRIGNNNAFLVKSKQHGGFQFSRDPFNLTNKHTRTHAGFVNDKAVSIQPGENGGVTLKTKKSGNAHKPGSHHNSHTYGKATSNRK